MKVLVRALRPEWTDRVAALIEKIGGTVLEKKPRFNMITAEIEWDWTAQLFASGLVDEVMDADAEVSNQLGDYVRPERVANKGSAGTKHNWATARTIRDLSPWLGAQVLSAYDTFTELGVDGDGVDIYIVDTGVDVSHEEFTGRVTFIHNSSGSGLADGNSDRGGHGTACAAMAAGTNGGVARGAQIFAARMSSDSGTTSANMWQSALEAVLAHYEGRAHLDRPAIVNMSWQGGQFSFSTHYQQMIAAGMVLVSAAGNGRGFGPETSPAENAGVLAVGGTSFTDRLYDNGTSGSARGPGIDIYAPAQMLRLATSQYAGNPANSYANWNGTSFAGPCVVGVLACMLTGRPRLQNANEVNGLLLDLLEQSKRYQIQRRSGSLDVLGENRRLFLDGSRTEGFPVRSSVELDEDEVEHTYNKVSLLLRFLDEDGTVATDEGPLGLVGTFSGGLTVDDHALRITGADQYLEYEANAALRPRGPSSSYTYDIDLQIDELPVGGAARIFTGLNSAGTSAEFYLLLEESGAINFGLTITSSESGSLTLLTVAGTAAYSLGERFRLTISCDGDVLHGYVNGRRSRYKNAVRIMVASQNSKSNGVFRIGTASQAAGYTIFGFRFTPGVSRCNDEVEPVRRMVAANNQDKFVIETRRTTTTSNSATRTSTIPPEAEPGDLLVLGVSSANNVTVPAGWTLVAASTALTASGGGVRATLLYRIAEAGDAGTSVTVTQAASGQIDMAIGAYRKLSGPWVYRGGVGRAGNLVTDEIVPGPRLPAEEGDLLVMQSRFLWATGGSQTATVGPGFGMTTLSLNTALRGQGGFRFLDKKAAPQPVMSGVALTSGAIVMGAWG